jgi:hypothetical protein
VLQLALIGKLVEVGPGNRDVDASVAARFLGDLRAGQLDAPDRSIAALRAQLEPHDQLHLLERRHLVAKALKRFLDQLPGLRRRHALLILTIALAGCGGGTDAPIPGTGPDPGGSRVQGGAGTGPFALPDGSGHLLALVRKRTVLYGRPRGRPISRLRTRSRFGSPTAVWIRETREGGRWVGVVSAGTPNGRLGWIDRAHSQLHFWRSGESLRADLSERRLELLRDGRVVRRITVTIGAQGTPTPRGRFVVTDKIDPIGTSHPYGCCILALSGRQPALRPGWAGGDRIAIHGSASNAVGSAASAGCLRAGDHDLKVLLRSVELGTPVIIRA